MNHPAVVDGKFYSAAYEYLLRIADKCGISEERLRARYLTTTRSGFRTMDDVFDHLVATAQNGYSMPRSIAYRTSNAEELARMLGGPSVRDMAAKSREELYRDICSLGRFEARDPDKKRNLWYRWCGSVVDGARFLSPYGSVGEFFAYIDVFASPDESLSALTRAHMRVALPLLIASQVSGMGFALACDFVKEMGCPDYGKPDVHLTRVFSELGLCDSEEQLDVFAAISRVAANASSLLGCEVTPYELDKVVWLICAGDFYEDHKRLSRSATDRRNDFIASMRECGVGIRDCVNIGGIFGNASEDDSEVISSSSEDAI